MPGSELLEKAFPRLSVETYEITSPPSPEYNCIAWAANQDDRWWWPDPMMQGYWPDDAPRVESVEAFLQAFTALGYLICENSDPEAGVEKLAIYVDRDGKPTHMARQLPSGKWTSKLGMGEDISHTLEGLSRSEYGNVSVLLKRTRPR